MNPTEERRIPAKLRPGKQAWLGPAALCLAVLSWVIPVLGLPIAVVAAACAGVSIGTNRAYRLDWTAVVGSILALGHIGMSLALLLAGNAP